MSGRVWCVQLLPYIKIYQCIGLNNYFYKHLYLLNNWTHLK
nr:MAG TPA: putative bacteriocin [Caudoviricetes sp.]